MDLNIEHLAYVEMSTMVCHIEQRPKKFIESNSVDTRLVISQERLSNISARAVSRYLKAAEILKNQG